MTLHKQAKILIPKQKREMFGYVNETRYRLRNRVMVLLSVQTRLRSKEISHLTWAIVADASGELSDELHVSDDASKGTRGRILPFNPQLADILGHLQRQMEQKGQDDHTPSSKANGAGQWLRKGSKTDSVTPMPSSE